jgi:CheY-like chemotaxis protein
VDDNADAAEMLGAFLELEGYEVVVAHSGPEALDRAFTDRPDTILMDIGMPAMDGYEVARRLRQDPALAQVVLIALTGYGQEEDRERSRQAGFDHHLAKPVQVEDLLRLLASPLNARSHPSAG